jgi:hypothetical protein
MDIKNSNVAKRFVILFAVQWNMAVAIATLGACFQSAYIKKSL